MIITPENTDKVCLLDEMLENFLPIKIPKFINNIKNVEIKIGVAKTLNPKATAAIPAPIESRERDNPKYIDSLGSITLELFKSYFSPPLEF